MFKKVKKVYDSKAPNGLIDFINKSPSPWHAVHECKNRLLAAGFEELKERDHWSVQPLGKYFVTRNMSTIIAFCVGGAYTAGNGFSVVGAHTDSPCLRVKPVSKKASAGYLQVGVELYGGGNWLTWFDRDLKLAGRVIVKQGGRIENRLVHINKALLRVPHIAIHLQRDINTKFSPNFETEICPVIGTVFQDELNKPAPVESGYQADKHHPVLLNLLAKELGCQAADICDFELCLADHMPANIGGVYDEFIFAPRLDNLFNVFTAMEALVDTSATLASERNIRVASFFDHEEIGSDSAQGAGSAFQKFILQRICGGDENTFVESMPNSYLISADQAHAVHPSLKDKHEQNHSVEMHKGIVIKFNCKQRYATNAWTATVLRECASKVEVPLQDFVVRNDSTCGSTIGPIMATKLAIPTIDIGGAQLSMHSIREQCCTTSVNHAVQLYTSFYENFPAIRDTVKID